MPDCLLCCERCRTTETQAIQGPNFGELLAEGRLKIRCGQCRELTVWKMVLRPRQKWMYQTKDRRRGLLLIDDDPDTLRILQIALRPGEYHVETADSATQAINRLQTEDYDVIVSDICMPEFDGRSLYRFLTLFLPDYIGKVVFLTGDHSEKTLQFLRECNCPYTFKPIQLDELKERIQEVG